jgi:hypothetical protein
VSVASLVPVDALREAWNHGLVLNISRLSKNIIGSNEAYTMLLGGVGKMCAVLCHRVPGAIYEEKYYKLTLGKSES